MRSGYLTKGIDRVYSFMLFLNSSPQLGFSTRLQYNKIYTNYKDHTVQLNNSMSQYCSYKIRNIESLSHIMHTPCADEYNFVLTLTRFQLW